MQEVVGNSQRETRLIDPATLEHRHEPLLSIHDQSHAVDALVEVERLLNDLEQAGQQRAR